MTKEHLSGTATPTEKTMAWLRGQGYVVAKVEQTVSRFRPTVDLFGCIDVVALKPGVPGVLGVQATTDRHLAERVAKVKAEPRADVWVACRNKLLVVGWALRGEPGKRKVWTPKVVDLSAALALALTLLTGCGTSRWLRPCETVAVIPNEFVVVYCRDGTVDAIRWSELVGPWPVGTPYNTGP